MAPQEMLSLGSHWLGGEPRPASHCRLGEPGRLATPEFWIHLQAELELVFPDHRGKEGGGLCRPTSSSLLSGLSTPQCYS